MAMSTWLNELEVAAAEVPIRDVVIEFEYPQLGQLIHRDGDLERASGYDARVTTFQLIGFPHLLQKYALHRAEVRPLP